MDKRLLPASVIKVSTNSYHYSRCGHDGPLKWSWIIEGQRVEPRMDANIHLENLLCPQCQLNAVLPMLIHCCKCGRMISPGEGIAVYPEKPEKLQEDYMMTRNRKWIGCMDETCCPDINRFVTATWSILVGPFVGFSSNDGRDDPDEEN